jgi:hypothetical protein
MPENCWCDCITPAGRVLRHYHPQLSQLAHDHNQRARDPDGSAQPRNLIKLMGCGVFFGLRTILLELLQ